MSGKRGQRQHGALHGAERGLMDVDEIDLGRLGGGDGPRHGMAHDALEDPLALGGRHQLRVAHAGNVFLGMKHHGGGDDGAGQTAAAHFIDARHVHEPDTPQRVLERAHRGDANHKWQEGQEGYAFALSFMRAALPFRSRR